MTRDPAEELAVWRYHLIAEALSPRLGGKRARPRRPPPGRRGASGPRRTAAHAQHSELIEEAVRLRLEQPACSAAHIAEMLSVRHRVQLSERTVREQLQKRD
jgi:hypothetical protein